MSRNTLKTTVLLTLLAALCVGVGAIFGKGGIIIGLIVALALTGGSYWFSDRIAIRAARAVPVSEAQMPDYYAVVRDLCTRANRAYEARRCYKDQLDQDIRALVHVLACAMGEGRRL